MSDLGIQYVDPGKTSVATKDVGKAGIARVHRRGMRQITQPVNAADAAIAAGFDDLDAAAGAFDNQAKIPGAARSLQQSYHGDDQQREQEAVHDPCSANSPPFSNSSAIQRASVSEISGRHPGIALAGRPSSMTLLT